MTTNGLGPTGDRVVVQAPLEPADGAPDGALALSAASSVLRSRCILGLEGKTLLSKQVIEEVFSPPPPGFYGRPFVVPDSSGGWRPVLDLSHLNRHCNTFASRWRRSSPSRTQFV